MASHTTDSKSGVPSQVSGVISEAQALWARTYVRRRVMPLKLPGDIAYPLKLQNLPSYPGTGDAADLCGEIPATIVEGLPAELYPAFGPQMVMYTLATLFDSRPDLILAKGDTALLQSVTAITLARCHAWAAIGRLPSNCVLASPAVLRYSARNKCIVTRPAGPQEPRDNALWRHFLAVSPPLLPGTQLFCQALCTLGPTLFAYGAALHLGIGQTYSLHFLERAMMDTIKATVPAESRAALGIMSAAALMTMSAAAVSGYRASVIRTITEDGLFVTKSQMLLSPDSGSALQERYEMLLRDGGGATMTQNATKMRRISVETPAEVDDDTMSVADTEALGENAPYTRDEKMGAYFGSMAGEETPRPRSPVDDDDADAIRRIAAHAMENRRVFGTVVEAENSVGDMNF